MAHHRTASSSSGSQRARHQPHHDRPRSPPHSTSSSSREPLAKRPRRDDVNDIFRESTLQFVPAAARDAGKSATNHASAEPSSAGRPQQEEAIAPNLESLLDEYDLGIDEQGRRKRALEESRRRRQAIMEKHRGSQTPAQSAPQRESAALTATETIPDDKAQPASSTSNSISPNSQITESFSLIKTCTHGNITAPRDASDRTSAAECDPDADRAQELALLEQRRQSKTEISAPRQSQQEPDEAEEDEEEYEEIEVTDNEDDDDMDMFALSDDDADKPKKKKTKVIRVPKRRSQNAAPAGIPATKLHVTDSVAASTTNLSSNWDDSEGYLRTILGETLDDRYQIFAVLGKGMFASVVRARDLNVDGREVAIKIIRVQESMYKAGLKEVSILRKLNESDPDDRKHVVRLERHFDYKGHLCMVFESLGMNLRDLVRRYGRDVGLNMQAVRAYAHQLFLALSHLAKNSVMHADIKPDNILVNDNKTLLKLCDLGSASYLSEMEITPYLVSRFYRAPEIILGQSYDCAIDVWSTGCTLFELATGKILFPGRTNNNMLLLMQELRGRFTTKQIRKSQFGEQHFDDNNAFLSMEQDKNKGQSVVKRVMLQKPTSDLRSRILSGEEARQLRPDELKRTNHFIDLLEKCLELDPAKRIKPKDALEHPFLAHVRSSA